MQSRIDNDLLDGATDSTPVRPTFIYIIIGNRFTPTSRDCSGERDGGSTLFYGPLFGVTVTSANRSVNSLLLSLSLSVPVIEWVWSPPFTQEILGSKPVAEFLSEMFGEMSGD